MFCEQEAVAVQCSCHGEKLRKSDCDPGSENPSTCERQRDIFLALRRRSGIGCLCERSERLFWGRRTRFLGVGFSIRVLGSNGAENRSKEPSGFLTGPWNDGGQLRFIGRRSRHRAATILTSNTATLFVLFAASTGTELVSTRFWCLQPDCLPA